MDDEKIITLIKPVTLGQTTYDKVTLREPTAGELEKAKSFGVDNNIAVAVSLISQVGKLPIGVVRMLSQRDLEACSTFLGSFQLPSPSDSETSSQS